MSYIQISMYDTTAKVKLTYVFRHGNISNSEFTCAVCGKQPVHKHHENYAIWYSFIPLCISCHDMTRGNRWKQARLKRLVTLCQNDILEG